MEYRIINVKGNYYFAEKQKSERYWKAISPPYCKRAFAVIWGLRHFKIMTEDDLKA